MIEADFSLPNVKTDKVIDLFHYGCYVRAALIQQYLAKDVAILMGIRNERTILKLHNYAVLEEKRRGISLFEYKGGA